MNTERKDLDVTQVESSETSGFSLAERERATINALFLMAERHPRKIAKFEEELLSECERPGFAEVARYSRIVGRKKNKETGKWEDEYAEGFSVRFAETAMRCFRNIYCDSKVVFDDEEYRTIRFIAMDLQAVNVFSTEMMIRKVSDRRGGGNDGKTPPKGREVLFTRNNAAGDLVFVVVATEDEMRNKVQAERSKQIREVLRFMPGDVLDKALIQINKTRAGESPQVLLQRICSRFDEIGVTLGDLQNFLGHTLSTVTKEEVDRLRNVFVAIKDGEETWAHVMEEVAEQREPSGGSAGAEKRSAAETIKEEIHKEAGKQESGKKAPATIRSMVDAYKGKISSDAFERILAMHCEHNSIKSIEELPLGDGGMSSEVSALLADLDHELINFRKAQQSSQKKDPPNPGGQRPLDMD
jgi:hypothetical protein